MATSTTTVFIFLVVIFNFATLLVNASGKHDCTINPTAAEKEMLERCKQLSKDTNNHLNKQMDAAAAAAAQQHGAKKITKEMLEELKVVVQVAVKMNVLTVVETHGSGEHEHQYQLNVDHALKLADEYIDRMAKVSEEIREKMKTDITEAAVKHFGKDSDTETDDSKIADFAKNVLSILNKVCNFKQHAEKTDRRRRRRR